MTEKKHRWQDDVCKKVIFVGIHNKPGVPPLYGGTRTGKLIDRVISLLPVTQYRYVKSNLFDLPFLPIPKLMRDESLIWCGRMNIRNEEAIIVALGAIVSDQLKKLNISHIAVTHPSALRSCVKRSSFVIETARLIISKK